MQSNNRTPNENSNNNPDKGSNSTGIMKLLKNDTSKEFLCNTAASTVLAYSFFPFEAYKKHLQAKIKTPFIPYRGSFVFACNFVPTSVIHLTASRFFHDLNPVNPSEKYKFITDIACGVLGATTATFVESCITRQQVMESTLSVALKDMFKQGLLRPWKSYPLIATRDGIFTACMFSADKMVNAITNQFFTPDALGSYQKHQILAAKFIVSAFGAGLSHPFDTVATNKQKTHEKISTFQTAKTLLKTEGIKGFYSGYPWRLVMFFAFSNLLPAFKNQAVKIADNPQQEFDRFKGFFKSPRVQQQNTSANDKANVETITTPPQKRS